MDILLMVVLLGLGILFMLGAGIALLVGGAQGQLEDRLEEYVAGAPAPQEVITGGPRPDVADRLDEALSDRGLFANARTRIAKADVKLRVSEYIGLQFLAAFAGALLAFFLLNRNPVMIIGGFILGLFVPRIYTSIVAARRLKAFENQLSDTLNLWVNALRSGYSVLQGMEAIATELPPPVSKEFERVVQEVRLGLSLTQALANMLRRMPSEDLDLVITAVNIQREVGGNLTEILDSISFTIRERVRIKGEIQALTAQGRLTGVIISLLPVFLAGVMYMLNPEYGGQLVIREDPFLIPGILPCGWLVIAVGAIMILIGMWAVRRIVDIEV